MVSINLVELTAPEVFVRMSSEKKMNLATLSRSGDGEIPPEKEDGGVETGGSAWKFSIHSTGIQNGAVYFSDRSVSPEYTTGIQDLNVDVGTIATDRTEPTAFSLTAEIDQYAPFPLPEPCCPWTGNRGSPLPPPWMAWKCPASPLTRPPSSETI